ncbi:hypothetical protein [Mycobacterium sp. E3198]|nr:hypothetical protein [Mycobacterium sp. E3198]
MSANDESARPGADWRTLVENFGLAPYLAVASDEMGAAHRSRSGFSRRT